MKNNKMKSLSIAAVGAVTLLGMSPLAHAQREAPDRGDRRQERRERLQQMTPEQRREYFRNRMQQRLQEMTPEQRKAWDQRMEERRKEWAARQEANRRETLKTAQVQDEKIQDIILAFIREQETEREPLRAQAAKLREQMADAAVTTEQFSAALATFRQAAEEDRKRYAEALKALDERINYTANPRLEAALILMGVVGEEASQVRLADQGNQFGGMGGF